jgi:hypothetical protein
MVVDALGAADPVLKLSQKIDDPDEYLHLTDSILETIENSKDPVSLISPLDVPLSCLLVPHAQALAKSRQIIDRLRRRDLYRIVDFKAVPTPYRDAWASLLTVENIVAEANLLGSDPDFELEDNVELNCEDVIVDFSVLHMGMKDKNPMERVRFYSKHNPNRMFYALLPVGLMWWCTKVTSSFTGSFQARPHEGFNMLPENFEEVHIGIFTRDATYVRSLIYL